MVETIPVTQPSLHTRDGSHVDYVDWLSALAGAEIAAAVSSLLLSLGSGIGLSLVSPLPAASSSRGK